MNTFIEDKKKFHIFFFHKSPRKNVPICHIAATPLTDVSFHFCRRTDKLYLSIVNFTIDINMCLSKWSKLNFRRFNFLHSLSRFFCVYNLYGKCLSACKFLCTFRLYELPTIEMNTKVDKNVQQYLTCNSLSIALLEDFICTLMRPHMIWVIFCL